MKTAQDNLALALILGDVFWVADILHEIPQEPSQHLHLRQPYAVKAPYQVTSLHPYCSFIGLELIESFLLKTQSLAFSENALRTTQALRKPHSSYWAGEEFFYQRMKVLTSLIEQYPYAFGELVGLGQKEQEEPERWCNEIHNLKEEKLACFLSLLVRQYSCDEWGNMEAASIKEAQCRQKLCDVFLSHDITFGVHHSLKLLKTFCYERSNVFDLLCQKGVFDSALKDDPVTTKNNLLVSLTSGKIGCSTPLYVTNLPNRSFLLKRAVELGVVTPQDCVEKNFSLFDVLWDAGGATCALMERGMRLPRITEGVLDGRGFTHYPRFTVEQIKEWQKHDRNGLLCLLSKQGQTSSLEKALNDLFGMYNVFFADKAPFVSQDAERQSVGKFLFHLFEESKASFAHDAIWGELHSQGHALPCSPSFQEDKDGEGTGQGGKGRRM